MITPEPLVPPSKYVWSVEQIRQVRGVRSTAWLPLEAREPVRKAAAEGAARDFIRYCHPFAVEVNPGDLCAELEVERFGRHRLTVRWSPSTHTVRLTGGPADGKVYEVRDAPRAEVVVQASPDLAAILLSTSPEVEPVTVNRVAYRLSGWHEGERCWVYSC